MTTMEMLAYWLDGADDGSYLCGLCAGELAVIILDDPASVALDEAAMAMAIHGALGRGLLVVL